MKNDELKIKTEVQEGYQAIIDKNTVWIMKREPNKILSENQHLTTIHEPIAFIEIKNE